MKELKKRAEAERKKILEEDSFLNDILYPMVEKEKKRSAKRKRGKLTALIASPLLAVSVIVIIVVSILLNSDKPYAGNTETKKSDLATINQCLSNTQIIGDFDSIIVAYNSVTLKHYFFTAIKDTATEESLINFRIVALVDRTFPYDGEIIQFNNTFMFLDYSVEYKEEITQSLYEDIPVNEFTIKAFMDTGQECFYITYNEISINEFSNFQNSLNKLIIKK